MPKNLYKQMPDQSPLGEHHVNHDMYKAIEVKQGQYFEIILKNDDLKSVLTWDFDVLNMDVQFTVLRTMEPMKYEEKDSLASQDLSVFDRNSLEECKSYFKEEPSLMCRPKESVQVINRGI